MDTKHELDGHEPRVGRIVCLVRACGHEPGKVRCVRRLFKCTTDLAPGAYRKRFRIPEFARP